MHRENGHALGEGGGHLPKHAASHQQAVRGDHARQSVLDVFAHVEYDGLSEYVGYSDRAGLHAKPTQFLRQSKGIPPARHAGTWEEINNYAMLRWFVVTCKRKVSRFQYRTPTKPPECSTESGKLWTDEAGH